MNSGTDSAMTYLVPSTSVMTVSGVQSARSTRSGFSANTAPLRRVTRITTSVLGQSFRLVGPSVALIWSIGHPAVANERRPVAIRVRPRLDRQKPGRAGPVPASAGVLVRVLLALEVDEFLE